MPLPLVPQPLVEVTQRVLKLSPHEPGNGVAAEALKEEETVVAVDVVGDDDGERPTTWEKRDDPRPIQVLTLAQRDGDCDGRPWLGVAGRAQPWFHK